MQKNLQGVICRTFCNQNYAKFIHF